MRRDQIVNDWNMLQAQVADKHEEMKMVQDRVRRLREVDARLKPLVEASWASLTAIEQNVVFV